MIAVEGHTMTKIYVPEIAAKFLRWRTSDSSGLVDRLFSSIAVDIHFEDRSVMDEAVDRGERHGGVGEDLAPFAERLVGGDPQRPALVARAISSNRTLVSAWSLA